MRSTSEERSSAGSTSSPASARRNTSRSDRSRTAGSSPHAPADSALAATSGPSSLAGGEHAPATAGRLRPPRPRRCPCRRPDRGPPRRGRRGRRSRRLAASSASATGPSTTRLPWPAARRDEHAPAADRRPRRGRGYVRACPSIGTRRREPEPSPRSLTPRASDRGDRLAATERRPDRPAEPTRERDQSLPAAARAQPGRLVPVGRRGAAQGRGRGQADLPVDRVRRLPLVPRDGARVVRGRRDGRAHERALRLDQGRPRGAPRPRRHLHGRRAGDDRARAAGRCRSSSPRAASRSTRARTSRPSPGTACRPSATCSRASPTAWRDRRDEVVGQGRAGRHGDRSGVAGALERRRARRGGSSLAATTALRTHVRRHGGAGSAARRSSRSR